MRFINPPFWCTTITSEIAVASWPKLGLLQTKRSTSFAQTREFLNCWFFLYLQEIKKINTTEELEQFMLEHGEQIIDTLGSQVDRIERNIKVSA